MRMNLIEERKERNRIKLAEKYNGKKDLLTEWEPFEAIDPGYVRDLRRRVRIHQNDLAYRGDDTVTEFADNSP